MCIYIYIQISACCDALHVTLLVQAIAGGYEERLIEAFIGFYHGIAACFRRIGMKLPLRELDFSISSWIGSKMEWFCETATLDCFKKETLLWRVVSFHLKQHFFCRCRTSCLGGMECSRNTSSASRRKGTVHPGVRIGELVVAVWRFAWHRHGALHGSAMSEWFRMIRMFFLSFAALLCMAHIAFPDGIRRPTTMDKLPAWPSPRTKKWSTWCCHRVFCVFWVCQGLSRCRGEFLVISETLRCASMLSKQTMRHLETSKRDSNTESKLSIGLFTVNHYIVESRW